MDEKVTFLFFVVLFYLLGFSRCCRCSRVIHGTVRLNDCVYVVY